MIHIVTPHLIVEDTVKNRLKSTKDETVDVRLADFDNTTYHISVTSENRSVLKLSIALQDCAKVLEHGKEYVNQVYGDMVSEAEEGYDFTLTVDMATVPDADKDTLATKLACVRRNLLASPFICAGNALTKGEPLNESTFFEFRSGEFMYMVPLDDRVVVIYDMSFKDPTDVAIAKVFLQEFNEVRRLQHLAIAPYPTFTPEAPLEIRDDPALNVTVKDSKDRVGFISFAFQKRHCDAKMVEKSADHITQFRAYLQYHIKCSKSHMHSKMRARVALLLKVLNRAVPDEENKKKKTSSGRTFKVAGGSSAGV